MYYWEFDVFIKTLFISLTYLPSYKQLLWHWPMSYSSQKPMLYHNLFVLWAQTLIYLSILNAPIFRWPEICIVIPITMLDMLHDAFGQLIILNSFDICLDGKTQLYEEVYSLGSKNMPSLYLYSYPCDIGHLVHLVIHWVP